MSLRLSRPGRAGRSMVLDALCVLVFAGIGRASHEEGLTVGGVLWTVWPFLLGACAAWLGLALTGSRDGSGRTGWDLGSLRAGTVVWVSTVVLGMLGRRAVDEGTAAAFVVVATVFLGVTMLGWRLVAARLGGRATGRSSRAEPGLAGRISPAGQPSSRNDEG